MKYLSLPLATVSGLAIIIIFCAFTLASAVRYPADFSPMDNWLSDLGSPEKNPSGDAYFSIGCMLSGMSVLLFMAGLEAWRADISKKRALTLGQACGTLAAFALACVGIFAEGNPLHGTVSVIFFVLLTLFIVLTSMSLWTHPAFNKLIGYYAIAVVSIDVIFLYTYIFENAPIWEWLSVFSALIWAVAVALNTMYVKTA